MARKYDIIERLKAKNERPFVIVDEEHKYTINTSKTNVMAIMALTDEVENKKNKESYKDDIEMIDKIIEIALGSKALEYIKSLDMTMSGYSLITDVIIAAIGDKDIDDKEESPKK